MSFESERVELESMVDIHAAATPELVGELGLQPRSVGSSFISIAAKLPMSAIVVNRALGLGLDQPESRESIDALIAAYRDAGVERYFVQIHPSARPAELGDWLAAAGLEKARGWQKFSRGREAVPKIETDLRIEEIGPEHGGAFGRILCAAFDFGEAAVPWFAKLPGRRQGRSRRYRLRRHRPEIPRSRQPVGGPRPAHRMRARPRLSRDGHLHRRRGSRRPTAFLQEHQAGRIPRDLHPRQLRAATPVMLHAI